MNIIDLLSGSIPLNLKNIGNQVSEGNELIKTTNPFNQVLETKVDSNKGENLVDLGKIKTLLQTNKMVGTQALPVELSFNQLNFPLENMKELNDILKTIATELRDEKNVNMSSIFKDLKAVVEVLEKIGLSLKNMDEEISEVPVLGVEENVETLSEFKNSAENEEFPVKQKDLRNEYEGLIVAINELITISKELKETNNEPVDSVNLKGVLKELGSIVNTSKAVLDELRNSNEKVITPKVVELTKQVNNLEKLFVEISEDTSGAKIEIKTIEILVKETDNATSLDNNIENIENLDSPMEADSVISRNSETPSMKIGTEKPIELNLEQLREKVNDKLEQIQKMITSKDKLLIQLNPKNLGNVEVLFKKTSEGMEVTVEIEEKEAKHQIEAIFEDIKKELKEKNIEFNFHLKDKSKDERENSERKNEYRQEDRKVEDDTEESFEQIMERVLRGE